MTTHQLSLPEAHARSQAMREHRDRILRPYEDRLSELRRVAHRSHAALKAVLDERYPLVLEHSRLQPLVEPLPDDHELRRTLDRIARDIQQLDDEAAHLERVWSPQAKLLAALEEWLDTNGKHLIAGALVPDPLPPPPKTSLSTLRDKLAQLEQERHTLERALPARDEALDALTGELEREAERALGSLGGLATLRRGKLAPSIHRLEARDAIGLLAAITGPEQMAQRLLGFAMHDHPDPGIARDQRAARLAEIAHDRRQIEREEESLIRASERAGNPIQRRPEADPAVVLTPDD